MNKEQREAIRMTAAANRKRKEAAREKWNEYWGCNSCDGCKRLLKHKEDFPPRCKMMSRIEDEINAGLIPYMDAFINRPADEYERWLIAQRNKFEASHSELTDILQKARVGTGLGNEYWCNINKCWWENLITLDIIRQELDKLKPQQEPKETPRHYNNALPDEDLQAIFEMLKNNGYFGDDSDVKTWLYVCKGGNLDGDFQPLRWLKSGALLAVMCDTLFDNNRENIWEIAIICFKNKQMGDFKVRTLSQQLARHNNKLYSDIKGADKLLQLLKL